MDHAARLKQLNRAQRCWAAAARPLLDAAVDTPHWQRAAVLVARVEAAGVPVLIAPAEARVLAWLALRARGDLVEVGRFCGFTTALFCLSGGHLVHSLDLDLACEQVPDVYPEHASWLAQRWPGYTSLGDVARRHLQELDADWNAVLRSGDSRCLSAWAELPGDAALAFVDGAHDEATARSDLEHCWERLAGGGILAAHDFDAWCATCGDGTEAGVDLAWLSFVAAHDGEFAGPWYVPPGLVWLRKELR